jgi:hypothetical protein
MMNYTNSHSPRMGQMITSSMFSQHPSDYKPNSAYTPKQNTLDIPGRRP